MNPRRFRSAGVLVVVSSLALTSSGCIETAVSAPERMTIACEEFADALEANSERAQTDHLKEAAHWADLAEGKDESLSRQRDAFDRLVAESEDDLEDRDQRVVADAVAQVLVACENYVDAGVMARIRGGALELEYR